MSLLHGAVAWRQRFVLGATITLLVSLLALVLVQAAKAEPIDPYMSMDDLNTRLKAGPVDATFKTVVDGATIESIPCRLLGGPYSAGPDSDLILFQASGPIIDAAGGIAQGMSGSPIYVDVAGTPTLVGAVSYGESFTKGGYGMATPIESMIAMENQVAADPVVAAAATIPLAKPLTVDGTRITSVCVAPTAAAARLAKPDVNTMVMKSLSTMAISGVSDKAPGFLRFKSFMAKKGVDVRAGLAGGAAGANPDFETSLEPGASVGALFFSGVDFYAGGLGTATYTTDPALPGTPRLVAFGHPMEWGGSTSMFMTNADVAAVWPSAEVPFKVMSPGKVRGEFTVDGSCGIAGAVDPTRPTAVPFTCTVANSANGGSRSFTTQAPAKFADVTASSYLKGLFYYSSLMRAANDRSFDGGVEYTLTVKVKNPENSAEPYTVTRANYAEDVAGEDAITPVVDDIADVFTTLSNNPDGTAKAELLSADLRATLHPTPSRARIADVSVPGGLRVGDNVVKVKLFVYGDPTPHDQDVTLNIPAGTPLDGTLSAMGGGNLYADDWSVDRFDSSNSDPTTLAAVVRRLNEAPTSNSLVVSYETGGPGDAPGVSLSSTVDLDRYVSGMAEKEAVEVDLRLRGSFVSGAPFTFEGYVNMPTSLAGQKVKIFKREYGQADEVKVAEATIKFKPVTAGASIGDNWFAGTCPGATYNATYRAVWAGDAEYLASAGVRGAKIKAKVSLSAARVRGRTIRATAAVAPADTGGSVRFSRVMSNGSLRTIKTVALSTTGRASCTYTGMAGANRVRAYFLGSPRNAAAVSATKALTLR